MAQKTNKKLPLFVQMDKAFEKMSPDETPFAKGLSFEVNGNPIGQGGMNNPTGEGQNLLTLTPTRSNIPFNSLPLPAGYNKDIGSFESVTTQELYWFVFNANGNHSIFVIDGNSGVISKVAQDPSLGFTDDQENYIADHRVRLRVIYDEDGNILEKFLLITEGNTWQKWINVIAAVETNGFDISKFPYWVLQQPHFDRRELFEWAPRPIMYNPVAAAIANTSSDAGKINDLVDKAFQFALVPNLTDGRYAPLSPYSLPVIIKSEDFLNNPDNISKNILVTLYAGSPLVESIDLYVRQTAKVSGGTADQLSWGPWLKYIRLYRFSGCGPNSPSVIGTKYWLRTNAWAGMNYDPVQNTIEYTFDNSLLPEIPTIDTTMLQNDMPQLSKAFTDLGDGALLCDNRYGFDNLPCDTIDNMDVTVEEKAATNCSIPTRTIKLYAYIGRCGDNFNYFSQVGYFVGADTTVRFGSLGTNGVSPFATFSETESKFFDLDLADKKAFRVYLKGTPYYADGIWTQVNSDNSLVPLPAPLDFSDTDNLAYVQNIFKAQGFFICAFTLQVPAGRYIATLGRHNVESSGDFINTSTYIEGIANSRAKSVNILNNFPNVPGEITTIKPNSTTGGVNALVSTEKEMEIDCTNGDIDVWGNGADLFYVYCPYITSRGNGVFRFIEGYLQESVNEPIGIEKFPYHLVNTRPPYQTNNPTDDSGTLTDKNGFYFAYTKVNDSDTADVQFVCKLNCSYPDLFTLPTSKLGGGYCVNGIAYLSDHNNGVVGDCNRILYTGKVTDPTGVIGYSNVAISIVGGATTYSLSDGTFTLIIHNGQNTLLRENIYINAGGNFILTLADCGLLPLNNFDESNVPCFNCEKRTYPYPLVLKVFVQGGTQYSLKENAPYAVGCAVADLAGRISFVNNIENITVPSYFSRGDLNATFFRLFINGQLKLAPDLKWFAPYVSPQLDKSSYTQWVGDYFDLVDASGNVVTDPASAVFISIGISSLYNYNVNNNFTILANYQFSKGDRVRILNDGNGNLLNIQSQILGTNYNQAAINADLLPNPSTVPVVNNTVNNTNTINTSNDSVSSRSQATIENDLNITIFIRYNSNLNALIGQHGFWIELYTPQQQVQEISYNEMQWYPVVNGEVCQFAGITSGQPAYNFLKQIDINYWDTYLFRRSIVIPNVGDVFFPFAFESPNISDSWGANVTSGGRRNTKNDNAKQLWFKADVIRSDDLVTIGIVNGLGIFQSTNRKDFSQYPWGGIVAAHSERSFIFFLCENDFFSTDYNFHYSYGNEQGVMITNLNDGLSTPHMKIGNNYGCALDDTGTVIFENGLIFWRDKKNNAFIKSDYRAAKDITIAAVQSYFKAKTEFVENWNNTHDRTSRFDCICGVDIQTGNIFITFRPRRKNTNKIYSYVNVRRNTALDHQETLVYSPTYDKWLPLSNFTPEGYGKIRGTATGKQMVTFAAGKPYYHNTGNRSFNNFYGVQTTETYVVVFNEEENISKIFQNLALDINGKKLFADKIFTNEYNSFSYVPVNLFDKKENLYYAPLLRDMNSYPPINKDELFRSMLWDGKRIFSLYMVTRFIGDPNSDGAYFELKNIYNLITDATVNKK